MRRRFQALAVAVASAVTLGLVLFFNVDYVRQNVELALLKVTGRMWALRGNLASMTLQSAGLRQKRLVYVYTPPGYDPKDSRRRYPSLYLLHGYPDFGDMGWIKYGRAPYVIDELIVRKKLPAMIVVFPDAQGVGHFGDSEYVDAPNPATANLPGARMLDYISEDLPQWIDAHFMTDDRPSRRWIGGVSTGAYGAVNIALQRPDEFGAAIALSGYYVADPSGYARPVWGYHPTAKQLLAQSPAKYVETKADPRWRSSYFYIGYGAREHDTYRRDAAAFASSLAAKRVPFAVKATAGKHSWDQWRNELVDAVQLVAARTKRM